MRTHLAAPSAVLAAALAVAVGLMLVPRQHSDAMKGAAGAVLRPGQVGMLHLRKWAERRMARAKTHLHTANQLAESERRCRRLQQENRRLAAELRLAESRAVDTSAGMSGEPLLVARCVNARVLGLQARAYLVDQQILDAGARQGVRRDALVIETPASMIDQGRLAGVQPDQLVLSRSRVWGKIVEVGPSTSTVCTVTQPGFRDLVRLAPGDAEHGPLRPGPQGILEGTGEPLARVRMVEVTAPVEVGDAVYTAAANGILPRPLLVGHVARLERPAGAAHWEIWVEPAVAADLPAEVAVLRAELNPVRVARGEGRGKREEGG